MKRIQRSLSISMDIHVGLVQMKRKQVRKQEIEDCMQIQIQMKRKQLKKLEIKDCKEDENEKIDLVLSVISDGRL